MASRQDTAEAAVMGALKGQFTCFRVCHSTHAGPSAAHSCTIPAYFMLPLKPSQNCNHHQFWNHTWMLIRSIASANVAFQCCLLQSRHAQLCLAYSNCGFCVSDSSLERVLALISKAAVLGVDQQRLAQAQQACVSRNMSAASALQAALNASPFSMDIFRLRLLDAKRLGLNHEVKSSQGERPPTPHGQPASPLHVACTVACSARCSTFVCSFCELLLTPHLALLKRCAALVWRQCLS